MLHHARLENGGSAEPAQKPVGGPVEQGFLDRVGMGHFKLPGTGENILFGKSKNGFVDFDNAPYQVREYVSASERKVDVHCTLGEAGGVATAPTTQKAA